jgi:cysteinyl-tRNA synthetase
MPNMSVSERADRSLAWNLHVELASRISSASLSPDEGLLSEALGSLYAVFTEARRALAEQAPERQITADSLHWVVFRLLNEGLRPFLTKWHPLLDAYLEQRPPGRSQLDHERDWDRAEQLRAELADLQVLLRDATERLAELAGAGSLLAAVR